MKKIYISLLFLLVFAGYAFSQDVPSAGPVPLGTQSENVPPFTNPKIQFDVVETAFAFQTFPAPTAFVTFPIPGYTVTTVGAQTFTDFASSGIFAPSGTFFMTTAGDVSGTSQLYKVNTSTGVPTLVANVSGATTTGINGLTYDPTTGIFYVCTATTIYTIDTATAVTSLVGSTGVAGGLMIDLAVDCNGKMYGVDLGTDNTYTINKSTGTATLLGPLGFNLNFGAGMTYDKINSILYLFGLESPANINALRTIDTTTGAASTLHTWSPTLSQFAPFDLVGNACPGGGGGNANLSLLLPTPGVNTNYVLIPHQSSMVGFGNNVTIEGWMKIGSLATPNTLLNKGGSSFDYQLGVNTTGIPFFRAQGVVATGTGVTLSAGVWTHLAVTYDGSTARFYKDGVLGATVPLAMTLGSSTNEMRIGRGGNDPGSGNIDEVRLWSVARSGPDINTDMCKKWPGTFTSTTGLKAVWHLDSTYTDSVSGYDGSATSGLVGFSSEIPTCLVTAITYNGNEIPQQFKLSQNYPNPFNPSTSIRFELPSATFVSLKVYDITGKEVGVLINDRKNVGVYIVDFDAGRLSSGIYFYTLRTDNFIETKKMMLIK